VQRAAAQEGTFKGKLGDRGVALDFDAEIGRGDLQVEAVGAQAKGGALAGNARRELGAAHRCSVDAAASRLDPAAFGSYPSASITGTVAAQGGRVTAWLAALTLGTAAERRRGN